MVATACAKVPALYVARYLYIIALILAGEMVFALPFQPGRFFRPTMLEVFDFTNTQLGDLFALYGIAAMLSYFPGGAIADHFSARSLLTTSLIATALGGLYMATIPGPVGMAVLYAFWGVTTIFLFWGALIRATREWGGRSEQGMAFGLLEGGRGLTAAISASLLVVVLVLGAGSWIAASVLATRSAASAASAWTAIGRDPSSLPERLPRFLCPECARALHQAREQ